MSDSVVDLSDQRSSEHPANPVRSGFDASQATDLLGSIASQWPESDRLDVLLLRALARLSAKDPDQARQGFSSLDIAEAVGEIRGRSWSDLSDKDKTSSDVRRSWQRLQETWRRKEEGVRQHFRDCEIPLVPTPAKEEGGGTGRMSRYRLDWAQADPGEVFAQETAKTAPDKTAASHVRYVCEDIDDAGWLARIFAKEYRLTGWKRWLITIIVGIPVLATFLLFIAMLLGTTNWSRVGTPMVLQVIASFGLVLFVSWISIGPLVRVIDRRITAAPWWMQDSLDSRLLEYRYPPRSASRSIKAVRYAAVCPLCQGRVVAKSGGFDFPGRVIGRCGNAPVEHVFSFDHVTRGGKPLR